MNIPKISFPSLNLSQKISSANQAVGNFLGRSVTHVKTGACKTAQTVKNAFFAIGRGFQAAGRAVCNTTRKVTTSISSGVRSTASKVANTFARIFKKEKSSNEQRPKVVLGVTVIKDPAAKEQGQEDAPKAVVQLQSNGQPVRRSARLANRN